MAVGDILEIRFVTYTTQQIAVNVRHWRVSAETGGGASHQAIANFMSLTFNGLYKGLMSITASFRGVGVRRRRPLPITVEAVAVANDGPGVITGDALPRQVSGIFTLRTPLAGRRERGRVYVPFPAESDSLANAVPSPGYVTGLQNLAGQMASLFAVIDGAGSATIIPVVYHRASGTSTDITGTTVRAGWATQRRRGTFGAINALPF